MSETGKRVFTQVFGVVGAIIERDGKFLLVRENSQFDLLVVMVETAETSF